MVAEMQHQQHVEEEDDLDLEWEEWDGKSPYLHHCIAGSLAGVAEHTLLYPVDTVKTHMQSYCANCPVPAAQSAREAAAAAGGQSAKAAVAAAAASSQHQQHAASVRPAAKPALHHTRASASSAAASSSTAPHGMWRTMTDLVRHGRPTGSTRPAASLASSASTTAVTVEGAAAATAAAATEAAGATAQRGVLRLWRGVQTMAVGCVPAHALYFSSYEAVKSLFLEGERRRLHDATPGQQPPPQQQLHLGPVGSATAGATAAFCHDLVMTPLDTIKQRLQLGHYDGMAHGLRRVLADEGAAGLYRSFPITLLTNLPYGAVMVTTNEFLRDALRDKESSQLSIGTTMAAGCGAGTVAAAVTTPLDRIKTRLQTQRLGTAIAMQAAASAASSQCDGAPLTGGCPKARAQAAMLRGELTPKYANLGEAARSIVAEEGMGGLARGMVPRVLSHAPAVAISWTTYEAAKRWLAASLN
uniref:Mitochondrial carrier protein n=1 Tax=Trieres chinensis TaxID=1514140 RepID=A0A7S2EGN0_TRICV|mmetsp:Transcript_23056/g.46782  ORF Transcript_23056/g.46782 Transcript_23056/m.46782 type:complete len:472 (+) Transcript_23056:112-1527(+)